MRPEPDPAYVLALTEASDDLLAAQGRLEELEAEIARLALEADTAARAQAEAAEALRDRDHVRTELDRVYGSLSWRATRPLRVLSAGLRRAHVLVGKRG